MKRKKKNGNTPMALLPFSFLLSNVAANSKNKEIFSSLFFSCRQRSKVIARVTRKSLRTFSDNSRAYLALAGGVTTQKINPVPEGFILCFKTRSRWSPVLRSLGSLRISLPMVAKSPDCGRRLHFISRWSLPLCPAQILKGI